MAPDVLALLRALPARESLRMAWRNGGGSTREIAASPPGAALDAFDWRVSVATVAASGPFSRFPGVSRTLLLLDGAGIVLTGPGVRATLVSPWSVTTLRGEDDIQCELVEGAAMIFNVMVRSAVPADVHVVAGAARDLPAAGARVGFAARGATAFAAGGGAVTVAEGDAVELRTPGSLHVAPQRGAVAVVASFERAA